MNNLIRFPLLRATLFSRFSPAGHLPQSVRRSKTPAPGRKHVKTILTLLAIALVPGPVSRCLADDAPVAANVPGAVKTQAESPWEKGNVAFGGFAAVMDSTLSLGGVNGGVNLNVEKLLNLDTELTVFRLNALYRPGESRRNQIDFTYAAYHRSGSAIMDQEIVVGDVTLPVGAKVDTVFNFDIIRADYSYAFLQDDRMRIAVGLGLYAVPLKYSINATTSGGSEKVENASITLPLPALALRADFLLVPKLYLTTSIDAMYLQISNFKGSLYDINLALEYRPWKHLALGLGFNSFSVDVQATATSSDYPGATFNGEVGVHYGGLMLYGKVPF
jgi:hypothetical protein